MKYTPLVFAFIITGCLSSIQDAYHNYEEDNIAEELLEYGLKYQTGLDIDFSYGSPEEE